MVNTKNEKIIQIKYNLITLLVLMSINFYSQKIDTAKIINQLWSAKKIDCNKIQNGELIINAAKQLKTAIEKYPNDIFLKANIAHVYLITSQFEKAKQIYLENVVKIDTINRIHESYTPDGSIVYVSHGPEFSKNDTTWIKMILEDFSYFKKEGISCKDFDLITTIFNIKKENEKLSKQIDEDETGNIDSAIYKLNKIISSHYFIDDYDYLLMLEYYLKNKDLENAEKFFNKCIEEHKAEDQKFFYYSFGNKLLFYKLFKRAVNYLEIAVIKSNNYDLKMKAQHATALLLSGEVETAKKIFIENIFETDSILGHIGSDGDSLIIFDSVNNKYNFIRMVGFETDWIALVRRNFEALELYNGIQCDSFYDINELLISQQEAILSKRIELKKEKK